MPPCLPEYTATRGQTDKQTLAVLSQKGGVGKTTLAIHLATEAQTQSKRVLVIDLEPQGSAMLWAKARGDRKPDVSPVHEAALGQEVERARADGYGLVVIDTAPHADPGALLAARAADLVLVPCRPAVFDLGTVEATLDACKLAKRPAVVVLNAVPVRSKVVEEAGEAIRGAGATISPVIVRQRVAFQHCLNDGRTAGEFEPGGTAAAERASLLADLYARMQAVSEIV